MIVDYLSGNPLKCHRDSAHALRDHLVARLQGDEKPDPKRTFVPMGLIRSPRLDAHIRPAKKRNWSYSKPRAKSGKAKPAPKPPKSAQDILNSI